VEHWWFLLATRHIRADRQVTTATHLYVDYVFVDNSQGGRTMGQNRSRRRSRTDNSGANTTDSDAESPAAAEQNRERRTDTDSQASEPQGDASATEGDAGVKRDAMSGRLDRRDGGANDYVTYDPGPDQAGVSERYGIEAGDGRATRLQRLEAEFGSDRVKRWADEGMPVEAMGKPRDMRAFREGQAAESGNAGQEAGTGDRNGGRAGGDSEQAGTSPAEAVGNVVSSSGTSLDEGVQQEMEAKMGGDFSDVQVHTGSDAAAAADTINTRAFTVGNDVAFNKGEYQPCTEDGNKVLAHELAHVRQQTEGTVSLLSKANAEHPGTGVHVQPKLEVSSPDDPAEREAERIAEKVVRMDESDRRAQPTGGNGEGGRGLSDPTPQPSKPVGGSRGNSGVSEAAESAVSSGFQGNGEPLPAEIRPGFESKMGADISDMRAHSGLDADEAARSTNAEAYAMDSDVVFKKSNYRPNGCGGKALLAHESTHVVQQRADRSAADTTPQLYRATTVDGS
jgi:hypothetical protein